jgi:hypothetical protein
MSDKILSVIEQLRIFQVRGQAVVLDSDLAAIYAVEPKVFNQAIKRRAARFPGDFLFRLSAAEWIALRSQIVTLKDLRLRRSLRPRPFRPGGFGGRGMSDASEQSFVVLAEFFKMPNWHLNKRGPRSTPQVSPEGLHRTRRHYGRHRLAAARPAQAHHRIQNRIWVNPGAI